jgi:dephospho-CoA kinase
MITIGLVGGVASGKSAVAAALARRGAVVFDADKVGHLVLAEPDVREELVARWGPEILDDRGQVSRPAVATRVFGEDHEATVERAFLEETLHGRIRQRIEAQVRTLPDDGPPAIVIDAPLLIESGWNDVCQVIAFVDAPREQRLERAQSRGWSPEEFTRRELAQMPIEQKRRWASHVIDNSGTLEELEAEVQKFWTDVVKP